MDYKFAYLTRKRTPNGSAQSCSLNNLRPGTNYGNYFKHQKFPSNCKVVIGLMVNGLMVNRLMVNRLMVNGLMVILPSFNPTSYIRDPQKVNGYWVNGYFAKP
jgi:hypothetical protein